MEVQLLTTLAGLGRTLAGVRLPDVTKARWQACLGNGRKEAPTHGAPGLSSWAGARLGPSLALVTETADKAPVCQRDEMPGRTTATAVPAGRLANGDRRTRLLWAKEIITQPSKGSDDAIYCDRGLGRSQRVSCQATGQSAGIASSQPSQLRRRHLGCQTGDRPARGVSRA
jgi:hypothetical protein